MICPTDTVSPRNTAPAMAVVVGIRKVRTVASERERYLRE